MSWIRNIKFNWKGGGIGALLAVGVGLGLRLSNLGLGQDLINWSYDIPFHNRPLKIPQEVVVVYMDDVSHQDLGQPFDRPWDRGVHAQLLERFTIEHARAVAFDVIFSGANSDHPEGDVRFARAIKQNGKVVLGAEYRLPSRDEMRIISAADQFQEGAAGWGFVQLNPDQDFMVREALHVPTNKVDGIYIGDSYSSISWALAGIAGAPITDNPKRRFDERWVNYYGPPGTLPSISFAAALDTNRCPMGSFSNKVVFVGSSVKSVYSGERKDELRTPYDSTGFGPAVDVQATETLNLLRGDWLTRTGTIAEILIIAGAGLVFGFGLSASRPIVAFGLAILGALVIVFFAQMLFNHERIWFPWLIIVAAQIPIALLWSVVFNSVQLYVQNRLYQQSLSMYLSPKLVKKFASEKDVLKPGAKKQMLTILFSDIASFTSISAGMDSDELAFEMNKYFQSAVSNCIHATDGTIVKYIGDAIFAFWNAPDGQIDHAMRGCEAALRFRDQPPQRVNGKLLVTRIGLHTGVANVGNFGSTARVDYTAIGENINLASRMEGLNKYLGTEILITETVQEGVKGRLATRFLGNFQSKGFEKAVGVHELVGQLGEGEAFRGLHDAFAEAVKLFQQKRLDDSETAFGKILEKFPNDGPTKFYLNYIAEQREHPLPDGWNGEIELKEK